MRQNDNDDNATDTVMVEEVLDSNDDVSDDDKTDDDVTPEVPVQQYGRGMRNRIPPQQSYQVDFIINTYKQYDEGSTLLQVPIHHYQADFTSKIYTKYDKGTALLNVHADAGTGCKLQQEVQEV